jgi:hypothetical protein
MTEAQQKYKYWVGLELICKKHYKNKQTKLFVNYSYFIKTINAKTFSVHEPIEDITIILNIDQLDLFKLPYSQTLHSVQGLSIKNKITIFDTNTPYVDRNFVWTAITRVTDLNNIQIFIHNDDEVNKLLESKINQYYSFKVDGYKSQDKKAGRTWTDGFVDVNFININLEVSNTCPVCKNPFETYLDE